MPLFIKEDKESTRKKKVQLPKSEVEKATAIALNASDKYPKEKGTKRMNKIAKAAKGETFNKKKGEDKEYEKLDNGNVAVKIGAIKRAKHDMENLPKNSVAYQINGGEETERFYNDALRRARTQNKDVKETQPTKTVKPTNVVKPVSMNNVKPKSIYVQESQLLNLKEDYRQLEIPFNGEYTSLNGQEIPKKMNYQWFIDWLEHIGQYGTLEPSKCKYPYAKIIEALQDESFVNDLMSSSSVEQDYKDYLEDMEYEDNEESKEEFIDFMNDIDFDVNEDGLIYVDRAICIPEPTNTDIDSDIYTYFEYLNKNYQNHIGVYWANGNKSDNISSYADSYWIGFGKTQIILRGLVDPDSVNWYGTILAHFVFHYGEEHEIQMKKNAKIQINSIYVEKGFRSNNNENSSNIYFPLEKPIIVNA